MARAEIRTYTGKEIKDDLTGTRYELGKGILTHGGRVTKYEITIHHPNGTTEQKTAALSFIDKKLRASRREFGGRARPRAH